MRDIEIEEETGWGVGKEGERETESERCLLFVCEFLAV